MLLDKSSLRADAPAFTPTIPILSNQKQQLDMNSLELLGAAGLSGNGIGGMNGISPFQIHPLIQQAMFIQHGLNQQKQIQTQKNKAKKNKTKKAKEVKSKADEEGKNEAINEQLPENGKMKPYKRVLAINLPENAQTIDTVTAIFHPYGDVTLVRVLKKGKPLPFDVKSYTAKLGYEICHKIPN